MMDEQASLAEKEFKRTGKIRVIVQDNGSIHKSQKVQQKWSEWEAMELYLFFLPPYCSQVNPIEVELHQVKAHELLGQNSYFPQEQKQSILPMFHLRCYGL
ncbi:MAG: transposase [Cyanobacteria bacterium P01_C01_bin.72]